MKNLTKKYLSITISLLLATPLFADVQPFCVAHRGNSSVELENSRSALISSAMSGVTAVEFDLHHTKDGVTIIHHDKTLERVVRDDEGCQKTVEIKDLTLSEVKQCTLQNDESIPLFEETIRELKYYPIKLVIEYKSMPQIGDIKLLEELFSDEPERLIFISFKKEHLDKIIEWKESFSFLKKTKTLKLGTFSRSEKNNYDGMNTRFIWNSHIQKIQDRGKLIGTFTKDSQDKIQKYLKKGVNFITTNYPELCMQEVKKFKINK